MSEGHLPMAAIGRCLAEPSEYDLYGRHQVIDRGTDSMYFTSDNTYDEMDGGAINNVGNSLFIIVYWER